MHVNNCLEVKSLACRLPKLQLQHVDCQSFNFKLHRSFTMPKVNIPTSPSEPPPHCKIMEIITKLNKLKSDHTTLLSAVRNWLALAQYDTMRSQTNTQESEMNKQFDIVFSGLNHIKPIVRNLDLSRNDANVDVNARKLLFGSQESRMLTAKASTSNFHEGVADNELLLMVNDGVQKLPGTHQESTPKLSGIDIHEDLTTIPMDSTPKLSGIEIHGDLPSIPKKSNMDHGQ